MMFAAGAEIPYVMAQVGHADSKVTLEIYARVLKRRDREQVGSAFDELLVGRGGLQPPAATHPALFLRLAGEAPHRSANGARLGPIGPLSGQRPGQRRLPARPAAGPHPAETREPPRVQGFSEWS
jgi:hypothetical protein